MKPIYLFIWSALILLSSCEKYGMIDWGRYRSTATLNGNKEWTANKCWFDYYGSRGDVVYLLLDYTNNHGLVRERIAFVFYRDILGTTLLKHEKRGGEIAARKPSSYFDTFGEDLYRYTGTGIYDLFEKEGFENYIRIDRISEDGKEIEGVYQLAFVISQGSRPPELDPSRPDTLIFTDGVFKARQGDW